MIDIILLCFTSYGLVIIFPSQILSNVTSDTSPCACTQILALGRRHQVPLWLYPT